MNLDLCIKELLADKQKVEILKTKRLAAQKQIKEAKAIQTEAQFILDRTTRNYHAKVRAFQHLDMILAEYKFISEQKTAQEKKITHRRQSKGKSKTTEQILADVMACLKALPADQRQAVIASMEAKHPKGDQTDD